MRTHTHTKLIHFSSLIDPTGKVHSEITNKNGNPNYKYFYSNADQGKTLAKGIILCVFFHVVCNVNVCALMGLPSLKYTPEEKNK